MSKLCDSLFYFILFLGNICVDTIISMYFKEKWPIENFCWPDQTNFKSRTPLTSLSCDANIFHHFILKHHLSQLAPLVGVEVDWKKVRRSKPRCPWGHWESQKRSVGRSRQPGCSSRDYRNQWLEMLCDMV